MKRKPVYFLILVFTIALCVVVFPQKLRSSFMGLMQVGKGRKTVVERLVQFESVVSNRLSARFAEIGRGYPPRSLTLIGLKHERLLEVWVSDGTNGVRHLKTYPILGASGKLGPKLREGDRQVPEGHYMVEALNPNSAFHLSLRLNYPNRFDREKGKLDGRTNLGSDIMIHGGSASIGCLAVGDPAAEDLFVLAAKTGVENINVLISPVDFRVRGLPPDMPKVPSWTAELYQKLSNEVRRYNTR